jgi:hypothetical protein
MSETTIPSDSILRRHFEQQATTQGLGAIPEDSILRRHYLHALSSQAATTTAAAQPRAAASSPAATAPAQKTATSAAKPKGWFSRLIGKMFGG